MNQDLDELVDTLDTIAEMVAAGHSAYLADQRNRWAIQRGWIFAGNLADRISRHTGPNDLWSELVAIRNVYAHYTPSMIDDERVWFDTTNDLERLLREIKAHQHRSTP